MRCQVRKRAGKWEIVRFNGRSWHVALAFETFWQAMTVVTGQFPYGDNTPWSPYLRPMAAS